jgi:hypothetical protein
MKKNYRDILFESSTPPLVKKGDRTLVYDEQFNLAGAALPSQHIGNTLRVSRGKDQDLPQSIIKSIKSFKPWMDAHEFKGFVLDVERELRSKNSVQEKLTVVTEDYIHEYHINGFNHASKQWIELAQRIQSEEGQIHEFWFSTTLININDESKLYLLVFGRHYLTGDKKQNCFYVAELEVKRGFIGRIKSVSVLGNKIYLDHSLPEALQILEYACNDFAKGLSSK